MAPIPALELWRDGALTVRAAQEFSQLSRTELFRLMRDGKLPWMRRGQARLIPRRALAELLAGEYAANPEPELFAVPVPQKSFDGFPAGRV